MPFLSKDWRSPGEKWVRYEGGWEMKKTVSATQAYKNVVMENNEDSGWGSDSSSCSGGHDTINGGWIGSRRRSNNFDQEVEEHPPRLPSKASVIRPSSTLPSDLRRRAIQRSAAESSSLPAFEEHPKLPLLQPHVHITIKSTKEVAGFNTIADALLRLDFVNAVRDVRRFNYVSKIVYMLFSDEKLNQLPGAAQKVLFRILEELAITVYCERRHEHVLRKLMDELNATMTIYQVWGSHLGSANLFRQHLESRRRIAENVEKMQIRYKQDLAAPSSPSRPGLVSVLPEECIREILLRISDPKDLDSAAATCETMAKISRERRVWRELVQTHFTRTQIEFVLAEKPELQPRQDWRRLYKALRWRFGVSETFAETLLLCRKCSALFWHSIGHPCLVEHEEGSNVIVAVSPSKFLSYFSL